MKGYGPQAGHCGTGIAAGGDGDAGFGCQRPSGRDRCTSRRCAAQRDGTTGRDGTRHIEASRIGTTGRYCAVVGVVQRDRAFDTDGTRARQGTTRALVDQAHTAAGGGVGDGCRAQGDVLLAARGVVVGQCRRCSASDVEGQVSRLGESARARKGHAGAGIHGVLNIGGCHRDGTRRGACRAGRGQYRWRSSCRGNRDVGRIEQPFLCGHRITGGAQFST